MQIQAVAADCDTCQQCQLLGQYVPNIARQVQGLTGGQGLQDNHRHGQVGIMFICDPFCPAIGDGISLHLLGFRNQSLRELSYVGLAHVVKGELLKSLI